MDWLERNVRRLKWRLWYDYVGRLLGDSPYDFLNFGFMPPVGEARLQLSAADEDSRLFIQLYHRVAAAVDLRGRSVLEVSCGRGGGAGYVYRYLGPSEVVGLDRSSASIRYCRRRHSGWALRFVMGDAEALQFEAERFDVVLNVEASHAYGDRSKFYRQAFHVLKPGGHLLTADFCPVGPLDAWQQELEGAGFRITEQEDLTEGVLRSLRATNELRLKAICDLAPRLLFPLFRNFAGAQGSRIERAMTEGQAVYMRFALKKPVF